METKLKPVKLLKNDTCLTYALKRVGLDLPIHDSEEVEQYFDLFDVHAGWIEFPDANPDRLRVGDILMWADNERYAILPDEIDEYGQIISHRRLVLRHFGVVEPRDMVSDCTVSSRDYPFCRTIRLQRLRDVSDKPTYLLRLKDEVTKK